MVVVENQAKTAQADIVARGMQGQRLPRRVGAISGFVGALVIIGVVTIILMANGVDLFTAPRIIASVMLGEGASGPLAIMLGTVIHLVVGTGLGFIFAAVMPPIYRVMWIVAGMIYGVVAFMFSALVVLPLFAPGYSAASETIGILLTAHVMYGFVLGVLGGTYGMFWGPRTKA